MRGEEPLYDLVEALLDGPFEQPLWSTFLDRLRAATEADYVSLIFRPPAPSRVSIMHLFSGDESPRILQRLYRERLYLTDPLPYHDLVEGRVYTLDELLLPDQPAHQEFRDETLALSGMNILEVMRVREPGGVDVWLTISRRSGNFAGRHAKLLAALAPFVRRALRVFVALERERFSASVAGTAIHRLNCAWVTLDAQGRLLDADAEGAKLLSLAGIIHWDEHGRFIARASDVAREYKAAVRRIAANPSAHPRALVLSRDPWLDMLLMPAPPDPVAGRPAPAIIAYIHGDGWTSTDRCEQIAQLFDLVPSEARLAMALSRGLSIAESAAALGITLETARGYSKRVFAKAGARGQPDLIRLIHGSVLAIA
jgi:DNA-binding CsgD family transcriptional regulator